MSGGKPRVACGEGPGVERWAWACSGSTPHSVSKVPGAGPACEEARGGTTKGVCVRRQRQSAPTSPLLLHQTPHAIYAPYVPPRPRGCGGGQGPRALQAVARSPGQKQREHDTGICLRLPSSGQPHPPTHPHAHPTPSSTTTSPPTQAPRCRCRWSIWVGLEALCGRIITSPLPPSWAWVFLPPPPSNPNHPKATASHPPTWQPRPNA